MGSGGGASAMSFLLAENDSGRAELLHNGERGIGSSGSVEEVSPLVDGGTIHGLDRSPGTAILDASARTDGPPSTLDDADPRL